MHITIKHHKHGLTLDVLLTPKSQQSKIIGIHNNRLKIAIKAPPIDGKANEMLISFLAKSLKLTKSQITIIRGLTSKEKTLLIVPAAGELTLGTSFEKQLTERLQVVMEG